MVLLFVDTVCSFGATAIKEMPGVSKVLANAPKNRSCGDTTTSCE
jgi:hypothetical protein